MKLFFADLAELLARVTVGLMALQLLAVLVRTAGRMKRKKRRRAVATTDGENYALWAVAAVVVGLSSVILSYAMKGG